MEEKVRLYVYICIYICILYIIESSNTDRLLCLYVHIDNYDLIYTVFNDDDV
jgi:hypothetical protein